jgi:hypothetical protein
MSTCKPMKSFVQISFNIDMIYTPHNWVVIHFSGPDSHYRVLGGWSGSYLESDHWRLNSGITGVEEDGDYFNFIGYSGSVYRCHKDFYGLRINNAYVWNKLKNKHQDLVELLPQETDWFKINWSKK